MRRERVCGHEVFGREEEEKWLVSPLPGALHRPYS